MPYYLRLLNVPTLERRTASKDHKAKNKVTGRYNQQYGSEDLNIHVKLSCTTDLSDAYYNGDLLVTLHLLSSETDTTSKAHATVQWKSGMRVLNEALPLMATAKLDLKQQFWLYVEASLPSDVTNKTGFSKRLLGQERNPSNTSIKVNKLLIEDMPEIIVILAPVDTPYHNDLSIEDRQHVLRRLDMPFCPSTNDTDRSVAPKASFMRILIYEELGESIARHIWDASIAFVAYCANIACTSLSTDDKIQRDQGIGSLLSSIFDASQRSSNRGINILELGAGCGTVGLGLARLIPNAQFCLTDLPEAISILQKNISAMTRLGLAAGTTAYGGILDWNTSLSSNIIHEDYVDDHQISISALRSDLILVSDCTYNPTYFQALIATLVKIVKQSREDNPSKTHPSLDVLITYKIRHESESQFFAAIQEAGFRVLAKDEIEFPDRTRAQVGLDLERVEIYALSYMPEK